MVCLYQPHVRPSRVLGSPFLLVASNRMKLQELNDHEYRICLPRAFAFRGLALLQWAHKSEVAGVSFIAWVYIFSRIQNQ